jgi:uncharacterized membrane protein
MTNTDRFLESASWITLILLCCLSVFYYLKLPEIIPTHFNAAGQADDYGSKLTIFILPGIAILLNVAFTILVRYPHKFNYPVKITPENMARQQRFAVLLVRTLKLAINLVFIMITITIYLAVSNKGQQLTPFLLPMILALVNIPLILYLFKAFRKK